MTRQESKRRRQHIAQAMRKQHDVSAVAADFHVSSALVRKACREFGVEYTSRPKRRRPRLMGDQVVRDLRGGLSPVDVARQHQASVDQVERIQHRVSRGIPG